MNYKSANTIRKRILFLINQPLKSNHKIIHNIVVLPKAENTRFVYDGHIKMFVSQQWLAIGFDHDYIYEKSGIYKLNDGTIADDDLTVFAVIHDKENSSYSLESVANLLVNEEVSIEDSEDLLHLL
jgi:hypothetical protein